MGTFRINGSLQEHGMFMFCGEQWYPFLAADADNDANVNDDVDVTGNTSWIIIIIIVVVAVGAVKVTSQVKG